MYGVDHEAMVAAFHAHKVGQTKFTRRMAINIADHFGIKPMQVVWYLEKNRLLKRGSYEWFQYNGGITKAHVSEVRNDRRAETPTPPDSTPVTTAQSPADATRDNARPTSLSE